MVTAILRKLLNCGAEETQSGCALKIGSRMIKDKFGEVTNE